MSSVKNAIKHLSSYDPKNVIIHDSARPFFNSHMIADGIKVLEKFSCVVPITKIVDTVKKVDGAKLSTIDRSNLYYSQTPQFFNFKQLSQLIIKYGDDNNYTDEIQLFEKESIKIKDKGSAKKGKGKKYHQARACSAIVMVMLFFMLFVMQFWGHLQMVI